MKTPTPSICSTSFHSPIVACALFFLALQPSAFGQGSERVNIKGQLLTDTPTGSSDALAVLEVDHLYCTPLAVRPDGKFKLSMPMGSSAYLRFEQAGYLRYSPFTGHVSGVC